jgi:hypothetical protein
VGLLRSQIIVQVVMEYAFLTIFGALAGMLIGLFSSELFVPFFRYTGERGMPLPPLLPIVAEGAVKNLVLVFTAFVILAKVGAILSTFYCQLVATIKRSWT